MKSSIWHKLKGESSAVRYDFKALVKEIITIANSSRYIAIAAKPTGSNWLGINLASRQMFGESFFEIPQHFSNQVLSDKELEEIATLLKTLNFDNVIFNGFASYFTKIIEPLQHKGVKVSVVLHGTFSELGYGEKDIQATSIPLNLFRDDRIQKLAAVRKDVAEFLGANTGKKVNLLIPVCVLPKNLPEVIKEHSPSIGVFGGHNFNKNLHNQVCGALLVQNAQVFVRDNAPFAYLNSKNIQAVGEKDRNGFLARLGSMDVNLHLSFSESWGQIAVESLALGIPCLVGPGTNLLDEDGELRRMLTVEQIDSPVAIARKIDEVLANGNMEERFKGYVQLLNKKAHILLQEFLQA